MQKPSDATELESASDSLNDWLLSRSPSAGLSKKAAAVVEVLSARPRLSSYSGVAEVARLAGANVATVTRTAQTLGFGGWPALQQELRARYLSSLSVSQVADEHDGELSTRPAAASIQRDLNDLTRLARSLDHSTLQLVASSIATATRTIVMASGSFAAAGLLLAHNVSLTGYDAVLHRDVSADFVNDLARCSPGDVLIAITLWRQYNSAVQAVGLAQKHGLSVHLIADSSTSPLAGVAEHVIVVPSEGVSFAVSLTATTSVVQAICAELAAVDPARTRRTITQAEAVWREAGLLAINAPTHHP